MKSDWNVLSSQASDHFDQSS